MAKEICEKMNASEPLFSFVVPVYNACQHVDRCINSIINQTVADFEVLLIDDGSTDGSDRICDRYSDIDKRIKTFHLQNGGVSRARNYGINIAKGKYVTFADSDDYLEPDALESYLRAFQSDESIDAVKVGYFDETEGKTCDRISSDKDYLMSDKSELFNLLESSRYYSFVWNLCIRRSSIGSVKFNESINWLEDHIFSYECYFNCRKVKVLAQPLYHYVTYSGYTNLSIVKNPEVVFAAMNLELEWKLKLNGNKNRSMTEMIERNYLFNLHLFVNLLYSGNFNYKYVKGYSRIRPCYNDYLYRNERIFFNRSLPFLLRHTLLRLIYWVREIKNHYL